MLEAAVIPQIERDVAMPKTIIVPLDGSQSAERALAPARMLALQAEASVVFVMSRLGGAEEPERYLQEAADAAGIDGARNVIFPDLLAATAIPMLANTEPDAMICMTTHGRSGAGLAVCGSIAEAVLRRIDVPVALVGPSVMSDSERFDQLIVCLDGSRTAEAILPPATAAAHDLDVDVWLVGVLDANRHNADSAVDADTLESASLQRAAHQIESRDVKVSWETLHGHNPAAAIVEFAKTFPSPLIAMTTHGRTGLTRIVAGSVTMAVVHHASCPVLVTRTHGLGV